MVKTQTHTNIRLDWKIWLQVGKFCWRKHGSKHVTTQAQTSAWLASEMLMQIAGMAASQLQLFGDVAVVFFSAFVSFVALLQIVDTFTMNGTSKQGDNLDVATKGLAAQGATDRRWHSTAHEVHSPPHVGPLLRGKTKHLAASATPRHVAGSRRAQSVSDLYAFSSTMDFDDEDLHCTMPSIEPLCLGESAVRAFSGKSYALRYVAARRLTKSMPDLCAFTSTDGHEEQDIPIH